MLKILPALRPLVLILGLLQVSCATKLVAVGEWGRPADLGLALDSLKDVRVGVRCGNLNREGVVSDRTLKICAALEKNLRAVGAAIVPATEPGADFTLWYLDRGVVEKRGSGVSMLTFLITFGVVPYISSSASEAELRVSDGRGVVLNRIPLRIESVKAFGWSSFYDIFRRSTRKQQAEIARRFFQLAQNQMVSQSLRLKKAAL